MPTGVRGHMVVWLDVDRRTKAGDDCSKRKEAGQLYV